MEAFVTTMRTELVASDVEGDAYGVSVGGAKSGIDDFCPEGFPVVGFRWDRDTTVVMLGYWMTLLAT